MADTPTRPPLEDPLNEKEIFANEIVGVGAIHGNVTVTLASVRFDDPIGEDPKAHRVVVGRLILTSPAAGQLLQNLQKLTLQLEAAAKAAAASGKQN